MLLPGCASRYGNCDQVMGKRIDVPNSGFCTWVDMRQLPGQTGFDKHCDKLALASGTGLIPNNYDNARRQARSLDLMIFVIMFEYLLVLLSGGDDHLRGIGYAAA